jgi:hypothetical protein
MATWKLLFLAMKLRRGWNRIPPKQRRKLIENTRDQVREKGPVVAKGIREKGPIVTERIRETARNVRKKR